MTNYLNPKDIECNFAEIFGECGTAENLKEVANEIAKQLKAAFDERAKVFAPAKTAAKKSVAAKVVTKTAAKPKTAKRAAKSEEELATELATENAKAKSAKTSAKKTAKSEAKTAPKRKAREYADQIAVTNTKAIKKLGLKWSQYSEKCYVLGGNTKPLADYLRNEMGLKYRPTMGGWCIPASKAEAVKKTLHIA